MLISSVQLLSHARLFDAPEKSGRHLTASPILVDPKPILMMHSALRGLENQYLS